MTAPFGVILAGGLARRMGGGDKSLAKIGGQTILQRVIERIAPQVEDLAINANGDPTRFQAYGLPVIADTIPGYPGPLAGVLAGLEWGQAMGATDIVTVAADTPFFPLDLVERLKATAEAEDLPLALAETSSGRHPTFGLWPTNLSVDLRNAIERGTRKVVSWTDKHGAARTVFGSDDVFFNVNTPEDLNRAEELAR